ncbi:MAG: NADPH:quinone oxidoreductase family protein [Hyphomicrobiaceae bacterium]|nr:NADPH:quinone oxidoreductase family protein [Hyphomicrobiaceae bacterium]
MKAALCKSLDGPGGIVIEELPDPVPGPGEVRVRVRAAGLNFLDTLISRGRYQYKPELPFSPAAEIAGEVDAVGQGVHGLTAGQRVCAYLGWGGARELVIVRQEQVVPVPDAVGDVVAAGVSVTYGTAMHGLEERGRLQAGETVAVLGAAGGAGLAAIEVSKLLGAKVIAVASSPEKLEICRQHGADLLLNYATTDLKQGLRDLTGGRGVDVVYDCVGGPHAEAALRSIAWMGRFLVIGFAAGSIPSIPLNLILLKSCDVAGIFWGEAARRDPRRLRRNVEKVLKWVASGELKPHTHAAFPLARTAEAIMLLDRREATGKVIVTT